MLYELLGKKQCKHRTGPWCGFLTAGERAQWHFLSSAQLEPRFLGKELEISAFSVAFCVNNNSLDNFHLMFTIKVLSINTALPLCGLLFFVFVFPDAKHSLQVPGIAFFFFFLSAATYWII